MRPWNPHGQTFHGDAITGVVPTGFIVYGPAMSARTGAMAQAAFASFCARSRLSVVPNPQEHGTLPDGSPFQITVISGVPKMKVWTSEVRRDESRRSGIGLVLTDLNGAPIPEHTQEDGSAQAYILTPGIRRGTRDSDGTWRVRKVPSFLGGKAVFCDKPGRRYLLGVEGTPMSKLPPFGFGFYGTNQRAYRFGEVSGSSPVISETQRAVGTFRDDRAILPFFRKHSNGELWAMQILTIFGPGGGPPYRFELYGGRYEPNPGGPLGEFITTIPIPAGYVPVWQSMSIHPDGTQMRMMFEPGSFVTATIGDSSIAISSIERQSEADRSDTTVEVIGGFPDTTTITTTTRGADWIGGHFGFDAKGEPTKMEVMGGSEVEKWTRRVAYTFSNPGGAGGLTTEVDTSNVRTDHRTAKIMYDGIVSSAPEFTSDTESVLTILRTTNSSGVLIGYSASGSTRADEWSQLTGADLVYDATTRTRVRFYRNIKRVASGHFITSGDGTPGNPWKAVGVMDSEDFIPRAQLLVQRRGDTAFEIDISDRSNTDYAALAATDPVTGAVCINVLERHSISRQVLRSWIFVADDVSVKQLHQVMDVADSTSIMIRSDKDLLSV